MLAIPLSPHYYYYCLLWLVASNLRKILRCILNENDILAPILCCNGENDDDDDATDSVATVKADDSFLCSGHRRRHVDDNDDTVMDSSDYDIFRTARQMLGTLNDDWNAYTFLLHHTTILHKEQQEQQEQQQRLDTEWNEFRNWTVAVHWVDRLHRLVT
jgi:hypothetical protein